jgi:hypothetical protein
MTRLRQRCRREQPGPGVDRVAADRSPLRGGGIYVQQAIHRASVPQPDAFVEQGSIDGAWGAIYKPLLVEVGTDRRLLVQPEGAAGDSRCSVASSMAHAAVTPTRTARSCIHAIRMPRRVAGSVAGATAALLFLDLNDDFSGGELGMQAGVLTR